ncbi:hypothetical protein J6590_088307 [Homalodisca vitripennis]|nr:hypothetical protein J6590_088307 [Homalodisca vitripennis]
MIFGKTAMHASSPAGLLRAIVDSAMTGVCKAGSKLCNIVDQSPTPPVSAAQERTGRFDTTEPHQSEQTHLAGPDMP